MRPEPSRWERPEPSSGDADNDPKNSKPEVLHSSDPSGDARIPSLLA